MRRNTRGGFRPTRAEHPYVTLAAINAYRYYWPAINGLEDKDVIRGFKDQEAQRVFARQRSGKLPQQIQRRAKIRLDRIDAAQSLADLRLPPSHGLETLQGSRKGQHSIRINDQWRICFKWRGGDAFDVEICDYH